MAFQKVFQWAYLLAKCLAGLKAAQSVVRWVALWAEQSAQWKAFPKVDM
jgi:hypothetical protein